MVYNDNGDFSQSGLPLFNFRNPSTTLNPNEKKGNDTVDGPPNLLLLLLFFNYLELPQSRIAGETGLKILLSFFKFYD